MIRKIKGIVLNDYYFMILYLILAFLIPTSLNNNFLNLILKLSLLWGGCICIYNLYTSFKNKFNKIEIIVLLFLGTTFIFNIFFYRSGENIKTWIVNVILLYGIFIKQRDKDDNQIKKELLNLSIIIVLITTCLSIISIILYIINKNYACRTEGTFQGIFNYNNSLAISAGISLILSIYLYFCLRKRYRYLFVFNCIFEMIIVILSEGRSVYLLFIAIPLMYIYINIKNKILRRIILGSGIIVGVGSFIAFSDKLYNFLSARNELWTSALMVIKENIFTGVGYSNLVDSVKNVRKDVLLPGIEFGGVHNIFMQVATVNGIIVLFIFIILLGITLSKLVNMLLCKNKLDLPMFFLGVLVVGLLLVNVFESNILYITSYISIIFWAYLGRLISIRNEDVENKK